MDTVKKFVRKPFDIELAKKIQSGEVEGKIKTRDLKKTMNIICYDSTARYLGKKQPIIAQNIEDCGCIYAYFENGCYMEEIGMSPNDLVLEVPDDEPQFKPFEQVLVRQSDNTEWRVALYSHFNPKENLHVTAWLNWYQCIPYEGNEHLVGTIDKPEEN